MKAVVLTSGGLDSAVALVSTKRDPGVESVTALWVDYGQGNRNRERRAASDMARMTHAGGRTADFMEVDVRQAMMPIWQSRPLLSGQGIPEHLPGHTSVDEMFVPGRNTVLVSLGLALAQSIGARLLVLGVHGGDYANFMDCRPDWAHAAAALCALHGVLLNTPLLHLSKREVVEMGARLKVPFSLTWSCYRSGSVHCGKCPACLSRKDAFQSTDILDPLLFL